MAMRACAGVNDRLRFRATREPRALARADFPVHPSESRALPDIGGDPRALARAVYRKSSQRAPSCWWRIATQTAALVIVTLVAAAAVASDDDEGTPTLGPLSARQAVREGNRLLDEGDPAGALEAYRHAETLKPDAREIPFVEGLAHFALGEYEQARQAFEKADASSDDLLADDAMCGLGMTYHAEALANLDNPKLAVSSFESAMQRYHNVLANRPGHSAAREANRKAATMWRQLKQLLEQQQQQQDQCENQDQDDNDQQSEDPQQQPQNENAQEEKEKPEESQDQPGQPQDQQQDEQQDQQQQQDHQPDPSQGQDQQQQQQAQPQRQEQALREQAQRRLREMMQALRERKKARKEMEVQEIPVTPVDKDW